MTTPRSLPLVALVLAVAVLVIQARFIAGGETWDDTRYHTEIAPARLAAADAVWSGEAPTWWDGTGLGVPLMGEPSHGAAYPPIWLGATPRALDWILIAHVLWAALGVALWARRLGASEPGAVVAGVLAATTGIVTSAALRGALPALAHVPWLGWAVLGLTAASDRRNRARAAIAIAVLIGAIGLAGQLGVLADAVALVLVLGLRRATWRWWAAAIAAGLAIASAQWWPAIAVIEAGAGARVTAIPLARLIELIVPGSFGGDDGRAVAAIAGAHPWAPSLYVGAPMIALALAQRPRTSGMRVTALVLGLAVLALVVGRGGGWPAWLGAPELHVGALALIAAAYSALGVDALGAGERRALVALGAGALATAIALGAVGMLREPATDRSLIYGGVGVACLAGAIVLAWRSDARLAAPILFALVLAPSVGATPLLAPAIDRTTVEDAPMWARAAVVVPEPRRLYTPSSAPELAPDLETAIATLSGAAPARWGIAAARSDDPARLAIHDRVWLAAANFGGKLLARFGIALAILPVPSVEQQHFAELGRRGAWALVRFPADPPAFAALDWRWVGSEAAALAQLFAPHRGPGVVLQGTGMPSEEGAGAPTPCAIEAWAPGAIEVRCEAIDPAYAVVSSSAADGWSAAVDGRDAPWVHADVLRRAVAMPRGKHRVSWRYAAPGVAVGFVLALAGVLGLVALYLLSRSRRPDRASRATT